MKPAVLRLIVLLFLAVPRQVMCLRKVCFRLWMVCCRQATVGCCGVCAVCAATYYGSCPMHGLQKYIG